MYEIQANDSETYVQKSESNLGWRWMESKGLKHVVIMHFAHGLRLKYAAAVT